MKSNLLFTVGEIDSAIRSKLKLGKAVRLDGVQPGHIVFAHPAVVMHLRNLFNLVIQYGHVPVRFGESVVVPLIKDMCGDVLNFDNYRGITISSIISKIFELCMLSKIEKCLVTNEQ